MNSRERLMATFKKLPVDRIAWSPVIDGYYTSSLPAQGYNFNAVETVKFIGGDILERHVPIIKAVTKNMEHKYIVKGNEQINEIITPIGKIYSIHKYSTNGKTGFLTKPFVGTEDDAKVMQYVYENTHYEPIYSEFVKEQQYIGDNGLATASAETTPIQCLLQTLMHIEPFTYGIMDFPNVLEELMEVMHKSNLEAYELIAQSPAEVVFSYEDTSTTVISPTWYDKYCKSYIEQYANILHKGNKTFFTHMCGKLKGFKSSIEDGSMDGIDSVCPPTTGDTWLHEALKMWPEKIIIGGIEPPALQRMNIKETNEYVKYVLSQVKTTDHFILSTGDATSYGTPIENLLEVTKLVHEYCHTK